MLIDLCCTLFVVGQTLKLPCEQARILVKGWLGGHVAGFKVTQNSILVLMQNGRALDRCYTVNLLTWASRGKVCKQRRPCRRYVMVTGFPDNSDVKIQHTLDLTAESPPLICLSLCKGGQMDMVQREGWGIRGGWHCGSSRLTKLILQFIAFLFRFIRINYSPWFGARVFHLFFRHSLEWFYYKTA